jgi:hypothetical protein
MNILWIEDFGGDLDSGANTLNLMFGDLLSFESWNEDELSILNRPNDLPDFCKKNSELNCIYLCRHYFDYQEFKGNCDFLKEIDLVIIDIRLSNNVSFDEPIPINSQDKEKFHNNAGFYIFNDLVHLGFPSEKMSFMTGEKNSLSDFENKCADIYIPKAAGFEKGDLGYLKLRNWIAKCSSEYTVLRRGIIQGCAFLNNHIDTYDDNIQFRDFIKLENNQPTVEIPTTEIKNYLDAISQFFALKEPNEKNTQYRLFLRTLVHEWEENIEANSLKEKHGNDLSKIRDIYTFAWLMKMTRNWVSHANLLEPLDPQIIAFLFLINMRAMFKLPKETQSFENILLRCITSFPVTEINIQQLEAKIDHVESDVDEILAGLSSNESRHFGKKINAIYRRNTGNPDAEEHNFKKFLLQYFWVNQKQEASLRKLTSSFDEFLPKLARHIFKPSFS